MGKSEGIIQFRLDHRPGELPDAADYEGLYRWFRHCRDRELLGRVAGRYQGYAYGNISVRCGAGFVISGTQTAGREALGADDLAFVEALDPGGNWLRSRGPARPSSEAMTHGEIYRACPGCGAVIHAHSPPIWRYAARLGLPSTPAGVAYGTPGMAAAVNELLASHPGSRVIAMGGHEDGIIALGEDLDGAGAGLLEALGRATVLAEER